jgi:hypothetical protein
LILIDPDGRKFVGIDGKSVTVTEKDGKITIRWHKRDCASLSVDYPLPDAIVMQASSRLDTCSGEERWIAGFLS